MEGGLKSEGGLEGWKQEVTPVLEFSPVYPKEAYWRVENVFFETSGPYRCRSRMRGQVWPP